MTDSITSTNGDNNTNQSSHSIKPNLKQDRIVAEHRDALLQVKSTRFDIKDKKELIKQSIDCLDSYLDSYFRKGKRVSSKHSQMGPAGKMIRMLRTNKLTTRESLIGQIVSIHENTGNRVSIEAMKKLEEAANIITNTLAEVPNTKRQRVLSEIDYGLYFARKKKMLEYLDNLQKRWIEFLQNKYKNIDDLNLAWGIDEHTSIRSVDSFTKLYPPTKYFEGKLSTNYQQIKNDLNEFRKLTKLEPIEEEEEEEGDAEELAIESEISRDEIEEGGNIEND